MIARDCDWFIALSVPVVIGRSNCFGFVFRQSFENRSKHVILWRTDTSKKWPTLKRSKKISDQRLVYPEVSCTNDNVPHFDLDLVITKREMLQVIRCIHNQSYIITFQIF